MKITIDIENCLECPHRRGGMCTHPSRKISGYAALCEIWNNKDREALHNYTGFPSYCPLPKEVAKQEGT